jgi:hypothetical protein
MPGVERKDTVWSVKAVDSSQPTADSYRLNKRVNVECRKLAAAVNEGKGRIPAVR